MHKKLFGALMLGLVFLTLILGVGFNLISSRARVQDRLLSLQTENASVSEFIQAQSEQLVAELISVIVLDQGKNLSEADHFLRSSFVAASQLRFGAGQSWVIDSSFLKPGLTARWPAGSLEQMLSQLPLARLEAESLVWARLQDPQGLPLFAILSKAQDPQGQDRIVWGLLSPTAWSSLSRVSKMNLDEFILVDDRGFAYAYTQQQYVGASLENHPVVASVLRDRNLSIHGAFKNLLDQNILVAGNKIPQTNLFSISARTSPSPLPGLWSFIGLSLLGLFAAGLISFVAANILFEPFQKAYAYFQQSLIDLAMGRPLRAPDFYVAELYGMKEVIEKLQGAEMVQSQEESKPKEDGKFEAYQQVGTGLAQALKGPLAAILGHAQLARSKSEEDSLKQHFVVIEREARKAREAVENLAKVVAGDESQSKRVELREILLSVLALFKMDIAQKGIKLSKDLQSAASIQADPAQLRVALEEIVKNAVEALGPNGEKEIAVSLVEGEDKVILKIKDTGEGMSPEILAKIFDPFFSAKSSDEASGMGLTVAKGVIRQVGGKIRVESEPGLGTEVSLEFPVLGLASSKPRAKDLSTETSVQIPMTEKIEKKKSAEAVDLNKLKPLVGSEVDELPAAPGLDEITLIGEVPGLAASPVSEGQDEGEVDADISVIRRPKVRSDS